MNKIAVKHMNALAPRWAVMVTSSGQLKHVGVYDSDKPRPVKDMIRKLADALTGEPDDSLVSFHAFEGDGIIQASTAVPMSYVRKQNSKPLTS